MRPASRCAASRCGGLLVELGHRAGVAARVVGGAGRDRVAQHLLDRALRDEAGGDAARVRLLADAGVVRDDVRRGDQPRRLDGDELGVAGAEPDAVEPAASLALLGEGVQRRRGHRRAAAASAHGEVRDVDAWSSANAARASFDSAAPMKPTGTPMIAAGRGAPSSSISSRWNRAVGALPIATTAPSSRSPHRETAAAERVVPISRASAGTRSSRSRQTTSLSFGSRARVTPDATMWASVRIGAPDSSAPRAADDQAGMDDEVARQVDLAGAVDHPHGDLLGVGRYVGQVGLAADRGERVDVDGRAVVDVVVAAWRPTHPRHPSPSRSGSTRLRHGVTMTSRPARARTCAASSWVRTPSGTATCSALRPSSCAMTPYGAGQRRDLGAEVAGVVQAEQVGAAVGQLVDVPQRVVALAADAEETRGEVEQHRGHVVELDDLAPVLRADADLGCSGVDRHHAEVEPAVDAGRRGRRRARTGSGRRDRRRPGRRRAARRAGCATGRRSAWPPTRPLSGDTMMLRTSSCVGDGRSPAAVIASTNSSGTQPSTCLMPRSWRLARLVRYRCRRRGRRR